MKTIQTIRSGFLAWLIMPFSWTKWEDLTTFSFAGDHFLLQGRLNTISGSKKFKVVTFKSNVFPLAVDTPNVSLDRIVQIGKALLIAILLIGCDSPVVNIKGKLNDMKKPVIVISKGVAASVLLKDGDGQLHDLYCPCFQSLKPGDTIK